jgi:hypothetical protein
MTYVSLYTQNIPQNTIKLNPDAVDAVIWDIIADNEMKSFATVKLTEHVCAPAIAPRTQLNFERFESR